MEYENAPQVRSSPYMSPMHQYGSAILTMTNPEDELYKMELFFRGLKLDQNGNSIKIGEALMNDYGVNSILGTVQALVNRVSIMSNLSKANIPMLIDFLGDTLAKDLMMNKHEYGIKSTTARDKIFFTALSMTFTTIKRGFEEGDKRFWKGSVQEIRTSTENAKGKSNGIFGNLNPWRS